MLIRMETQAAGGSLNVNYITLSVNQEFSIKIKNGVFYVDLNGSQSVGGYGAIKNGELITDLSFTAMTYCNLTYDQNTNILSGKITYNYGNGMRFVYVSDME